MADKDLLHPLTLCEPIDQLKGKNDDMRRASAKLKDEIFKEKKRAETKNKNVNKYLEEIDELTKRDKVLQKERDDAVGNIDELSAELDAALQESEEMSAAVKRMEESTQEMEQEKEEGAAQEEIPWHGCGVGSSCCTFTVAGEPAEDTGVTARASLARTHARTHARAHAHAHLS